MKWIASFIVNRLLIAAFLWFVVTTYARTSCQFGWAGNRDLGQLFATFRDIVAALQ